MLNSSHLTHWFGLPVEVAQPDTRFDFQGSIYRFAFSYDTEDDPVPMLERFLNTPGVEQTRAVVCGMPGESDTPMEGYLDMLAKYRSKLPELKGLFLGDIVQEENEMSWIEQGEVSRMITAFPSLEELRVRGQNSLVFNPSESTKLTKLVVETGGMPKEVLQGIAESKFPELIHLELWLGTDEYGWNGSIEDILPFLFSPLFPKLKHLALGNSALQNEIAGAIATAPILDQLETLDLSLGVMTDVGAAQLLASPKIERLRKLNLTRNFLTPAAINAFAGLGIEVVAGDQETPDNFDGEPYYYVAVGE